MSVRFIHFIAYSLGSLILIAVYIPLYDFFLPQFIHLPDGLWILGSLHMGAFIDSTCLR